MSCSGLVKVEDEMTVILLLARSYSLLSSFGVFDKAFPFNFASTLQYFLSVILILFVLLVLRFPTTISLILSSLPFIFPFPFLPYSYSFRLPVSRFP